METIVVYVSISLSYIYNTKITQMRRFPMAFLTLSNLELVLSDIWHLLDSTAIIMDIIKYLKCYICILIPL